MFRAGIIAAAETAAFRYVSSVTTPASQVEVPVAGGPAVEVPGQIEFGSSAFFANLAGRAAVSCAAAAASGSSCGAAALSVGFTSGVGAWQTTEWNLTDPSRYTVADWNSSDTHWDQLIEKVLIQGGGNALVSYVGGGAPLWGFVRGASFSLGHELYTFAVPQEPDLIGKGDGGGRKYDGDMVLLGVNNFGTWQTGTDADGCFTEGGACSRVMDVVPGMRAISYLHDPFAVLGQGSVCESDACATTMLPAAIITYSAIVQRVKATIPPGLH